MNSETLYTFVQLAEYRNFTRTAGKLYVAQSTVTNRIAELEEELGKQLVVRSKKQLQLTPEGELFLSYARRILALEESVKKELDKSEQFEHSLRIGTTNTIYDCHLKNPMIEYLGAHKNVKIKVTLGHSLPLVQMLLDNTLDLAFTYVPCRKPGVLCSPFQEEKLVLVTHPSNTRFKQGITREELASLPYYYVDFTFQDLGSHIRDLFPKGHAFPFEIDRGAHVIPYLLRGEGYSFLPESLVREELSEGRLIAVPLLDIAPLIARSYVLTTEQSDRYMCVKDFLQSIY